MKPLSHPARGRDLGPWPLWARGVSHSQGPLAGLFCTIRWLSLPPTSPHIQITCYYMSRPLDAFQRETVPLCNESCAPQAILQSPEQRQRQREGERGVIGAVTGCERGCDSSYDTGSDRLMGL